MSSLTTTTTRITFAGTGVITPFNTTFWVQNAADIVVYKRVDSTEVDTLQVLTTNYTVASLDNFSGAVVTLVDSNGDEESLASGTTLIIYRDPSEVNNEDLSNTTSLFPRAITRSFDYLTALIQNTRHVQARSIRLPSRHALTFNEMLVDDDNTDLASRFVAIRSDGVTPWVAAATTVPVSVLMVLLLEALTTGAAHIVLAIDDRIFETGGSEGQTIVKINATNFNVEWATVVPIDGTVGQILEKASGTKFDSAWVNKIVTPSTVLVQTTNAKTLVIGEAQQWLQLSDGSAVAVTVPPNVDVAFPVGTEITFEQGAAGAITIGPGAAVTLEVESTFTLVSNGAFAVIGIKKTATNVWNVFGNLVPA